MNKWIIPLLIFLSIFVFTRLFHIFDSIIYFVSLLFFFVFAIITITLAENRMFSLIMSIIPLIIFLFFFFNVGGNINKALSPDIDKTCQTHLDCDSFDLISAFGNERVNCINSHYSPVHIFPASYSLTTFFTPSYDRPGFCVCEESRCQIKHAEKEHFEAVPAYIIEENLSCEDFFREDYLIRWCHERIFDFVKSRKLNQYCDKTGLQKGYCYSYLAVRETNVSLCEFISPDNCCAQYGIGMGKPALNFTIKDFCFFEVAKKWNEKKICSFLSEHIDFCNQSITES